MRRFALFFCSTILTAAVPLFNGKDLTGWTHEGPRATFSAQNGELTTSGAGNAPNWLHTDKEYENFRLHVEYKLAQWAEAAIIVRAPRLGRPARAGIALTLAHDFHNDNTPYVTGGIQGFRPPLRLQPVEFGKWHTVTIELTGEHFVASIDGLTVQDVEVHDRLRRGFIGFPDLGHSYSLRNITIEDLGGTEKYTDLFDGTTLTGWKLRNGGNWSIRDGAIYGANGDGILYAPGKFHNFELTLLVCSHNRVNSGVFLRGSPALKEYRGFEVQIYSPVDAVFPTGSVYAKDRANVSEDYEEKWFLMQILVNGSTCRVRIDGALVSEFTGLTGRDLDAGQIGLQIHMINASAEFRDIRVRLLQP